MSFCQRCGTPLSPRARKWCSENCRKRAFEHAHPADQYAECPYCGDPWKNRQSKKCIECVRAINEVKRTIAEGAWAVGWSEREIKMVLGAPGWCAAPYRKAGWDLPRRYPVRDDGMRAPFGLQIAA